MPNHIGKHTDQDLGEGERGGGRGGKGKRRAIDAINVDEESRRKEILEREEGRGITRRLCGGGTLLPLRQKRTNSRRILGLSTAILGNGEVATNPVLRKSGLQSTKKPTT